MHRRDSCECPIFTRLVGKPCVDEIITANTILCPKKFGCSMLPEIYGPLRNRQKRETGEAPRQSP